jgi:hypothetical protein
MEGDSTGLRVHHVGAMEGGSTGQGAEGAIRQSNGGRLHRLRCTYHRPSFCTSTLTPTRLPGGGPTLVLLPVSAASCFENLVAPMRRASWAVMLMKLWPRVRRVCVTSTFRVLR